MSAQRTDDPNWWRFYGELEPELKVEAREAAERIRALELLEEASFHESERFFSTRVSELNRLKSKLGDKLFSRWLAVEGMVYDERFRMV